MSQGEKFIVRKEAHYGLAGSPKRRFESLARLSRGNGGPSLNLCTLSAMDRIDPLP